jgi:hypothetical protein
MGLRVLALQLRESPAALIAAIDAVSHLHRGVARELDLVAGFIELRDLAGFAGAPRAADEKFGVGHASSLSRPSSGGSRPYAAGAWLPAGLTGLYLFNKSPKSKVLSSPVTRT